MPEARDARLYQAALYIRLSKEDGDKFESNSISNQRDFIYTFLKNKKDIKVCTEKVDNGYSGVDFNRPALLELLEEVKQGKIDCIIVKDLSRFGRNYIETGRYIQQIFPFMGVRFIAINDHYDSSSLDYQMYNMVLPFKNLINDFYSRDISVKVRSQIEVRQKQGDYIGSFPVYGYLRDQSSKGKLVVDQVAASVVKDIFNMRIKGCNNKEIANYLNQYGIPSPMEYKTLLHWKYSTSFKLNPQAKWYPVTVERILKNEIYIGNMVQGKEKTLNYKVKKRVKVNKENWIRVENTHPAIIPKEDFEIVKKLMLRDTRTAPQKNNLYLFSGLLCCGGCGGNMVRKKIRSAGKDYIYYICSNNKNNKTVCSSHRIREEYLSKIILEILQTYVSTIYNRNELENNLVKLTLQEYELQKKNRQLEERKADLVRNQKLKNSLYQDYKDAVLTKNEYLEMKKEYEDICKILKKIIQTLEPEIEEQRKEIGLYSQFLEEWKENGKIPGLSRALLVLVIEKIVVIEAGYIKIYFKYRNEFCS